MRTTILWLLLVGTASGVSWYTTKEIYSNAKCLNIDDVMRDTDDIMRKLALDMKKNGYDEGFKQCLSNLEEVMEKNGLEVCRYGAVGPGLSDIADELRQLRIAQEQQNLQDRIRDIRETGER